MLRRLATAWTAFRALHRGDIEGIVGARFIRTRRDDLRLLGFDLNSYESLRKHVREGRRLDATYRAKVESKAGNWRIHRPTFAPAHVVTDPDRARFLHLTQLAALRRAVG